MVAIEIPRRVWSQNAQRTAHWAKIHKEKQAWKSYILSRAGRGECDCKATLHITSYRVRLITDNANLIGGCKELVDALVQTGWLYDDSDDWVTITYSQVRAPKAEERTTLEIHYV